MYNPIVPGGIIRLNQGVYMILKKPGQHAVLRCKVTLAHDPAGPLSTGIEDQQAPAPIVPADLRACQVDGTVSFFGLAVIPEKRTGFGAFQKNTLITKERDLVRVNGYCCSFTGILVLYKEMIIPQLFQYRMDQAKVAATFTALAAFKRQSYHRYRVLH
jgi:hypothetical protein